MKKILRITSLLALLAAATPQAVTATTFFTDNFSNGSTLNLTSVPGGTAPTSSTSYDVASTKTTVGSTTIAANRLALRLSGGTTTGWAEAQALFTTNPVALTQVNDYIDITVVFTNAVFAATNYNGTLLAGGTGSLLWLGLYNSGSSASVSNPPVAGALANGGLSTTNGSAYAAGNCASWQGYVSQISSNGTSRIFTRPVQNGAGTASANQELLGDNAGSGAFNNPRAASIASATAAVTLATNVAYTMELKIILSDVNVLTISNNLYSGAGTGGTMIFSLASTNVSGTTNITSVFDGLAIGAFNKGISINPCMDISSISITGQSSAPVPPSIVTQPVPVSVANGGSCIFTVAATGNGLTYQWHRNNTNLLNGGNISGATTSQLVISPAGAADVLSGANGYYVTVTGAGNLSTNSATNSLTLATAKNLIYTGSGPWDLNSTANWWDITLSPTFTFNFGDAVTFDDNGGGGTVNLTGSYLSASSVTVDSGYVYTLSGTGSFAGPGSLLYKGANQLTVNNANTFTGGTTISNATANLRLQNLNGLGTGPIRMAKAGGKMEIVPASSSASSLPNDLIVADDFQLILDAVNSGFALVLNGNISGTNNKTLTIDHSSSGGIGTTPSRIRINGTSTICNANIVLDDNLLVWSPSHGSGSQTYNGVISGAGAFLQKSSTTYLNALNTYSGGTTPAAGSIGLGVSSVSSSPPTVDSGPIGTGPLLLVNDSTTSLAGSGTIFAFGGARTIDNPIQYVSGSNNLTLIIGGTNRLTLTGAFSLNGNDGGGAGTNRTIQSDNTAGTTLSGQISDGGLGMGLIKTGTNTLYLNGNNSYTGLTTVSAGVLAGSGTVAGSVLVNTTNASIGGGDATGLGAFHVSGNLTFSNGGGIFRVNRSGSQSDQIIVTGNVTNNGAGTITITNNGAALQAGDTFTIFNKAVVNGSSLIVTGGGTGVVWTNLLAQNGTIKVIPGFANYSTNITFSVSGNTLTLGWPATHLGWILQQQTNSLNTGLTSPTNTWFDVVGSSSLTVTNITVNPANPTVFFRLRHP